MPYAIGKTVRGVYEVVRVVSRDEAIAKTGAVIRDGHAKCYEFEDMAEKECRAMNKERLRGLRVEKASQMRLDIGGDE